MLKTVSLKKFTPMLVILALVFSLMPTQVWALTFQDWYLNNHENNEMAWHWYIVNNISYDETIFEVDLPSDFVVNENLQASDFQFERATGAGCSSTQVYGSIQYCDESDFTDCSLPGNREIVVHVDRDSNKIQFIMGDNLQYYSCGRFRIGYSNSEIIRNPLQTGNYSVTINQYAWSNPLVELDEEDAISTDIDDEFIYDSEISNPQITLSSSKYGNDADYTLTFKLKREWKNNTDLEIEFPVEYDISGLTEDDVDISGSIQGEVETQSVYCGDRALASKSIRVRMSGQVLKFENCRRDQTQYQSHFDYDEDITVKIGSHADQYGQGSNQITNPDTGSYNLTVGGDSGLLGSFDIDITAGDLPTLNGFEDQEFDASGIIDETTDFSAVGDLTAVPNMTLANNQGSIKWTGGTVNAEAANFIDNVKVDNGLVSVDSTVLAGRGIDAAATVKMRVNNCEGVALYYSPSAYDSFNDLKTNYQEFCTIDDTSGCSTINSASCRNNILTLTVTGFSSYGAEGVGGVADYVFTDHNSSDGEMHIDSASGDDRDLQISWTRPGAIEYQNGDTITIKMTDEAGAPWHATNQFATCSATVAPTNNSDEVAGAGGAWDFSTPGTAIWTFSEATTTNAMEVCLQLPQESDSENVFVSVLGYTYGGGLIYVNDSNDVTVTAEVTPQLEFSIRDENDSNDTNACDLGTLAVNSVSSCAYRLKVKTNASSGYEVRIATDGELRKAGTAGSVSDLDKILPVTNGTTVITASEAYGVAIDAGQTSTGVVPQEQGIYSVDDSPLEYVSTAELLYTVGAPNVPSNTGDTTNTALVTHKASILAGTSAGNYAQQVKYYVTANF